MPLSQIKFPGVALSRSWKPEEPKQQNLWITLCFLGLVYLVLTCLKHRFAQNNQKIGG